jgi:hypothetical protein
MASRGSKIQRIVEHFRSTDLDEARVTFQLVKEVMDGRLSPLPAQATLALKTRKTRTPRKKHAGEPAEHASGLAPLAVEGQTIASV